MNVPTNLVDVHNVPVHYLNGDIVVITTLFEDSVGTYQVDQKFSSRKKAEQFINDCKLKLWASSFAPPATIYSTVTTTPTAPAANQTGTRNVPTLPNVPPNKQKSITTPQKGPDNMYITNLEYGVIMQALQNAQAEHIDGDFVDPYAENEEGYTDQDFEVALKSVENKLRDYYIRQEKEAANIPT